MALVGETAGPPSSASSRRCSASCSSRAFAAIALTASNSSRETRSIPEMIRSSWSRMRDSTSPRTPDSAPTAPEASRARSSNRRFWLCIDRLLGSLALRRPTPRGMGIDGLLDRRGGLAGKVDVMARREIVAALQQLAALLEFRMDEAGHQLVMPLGRLPVGPILRQLAQHAEPAGAGHEPVDIGNRVVGRADAGGAGLDQPLHRVADLWRNDRKGRHVAEIIGEGPDAELHVLDRLLARVGD